MVWIINWNSSPLLVFVCKICNICLEKSLCSIEANLYVVCSTCSSVFHQKCVQYESTRPDEVGWTCDDCGKPGTRKPVNVHFVFIDVIEKWNRALKWFVVSKLFSKLVGKYTLVENVVESPSKKARDLEAQTLYVSNYGLRKNRKQNE